MLRDVTDWPACPACEGTGRVEQMTWLSYDGRQAWQGVECGCCGGCGVVEPEPVEEADNEAE